MSDCCSVKGTLVAPGVAACPENGARSKQVDVLTVKSLVRRLPLGMLDTQAVLLLRGTGLRRSLFRFGTASANFPSWRYLGAGACERNCGPNPCLLLLWLHPEKY